VASNANKLGLINHHLLYSVGFWERDPYAGSSILEKFHQHKADYDRWITGMRRLRSNIIDKLGTTRLESMHKLV